MNPSFDKLTREIQVMPDFVLKALKKNSVLKDYKKRPAYQQNDYISWILRAKRIDTQLKRIDQMCEELKKGGVYMKMKHKGSIK